MSTILVLKNKGTGLDPVTARAAPTVPSPGAGDYAKSVVNSLREILKGQRSPSLATSVPLASRGLKARSISERLYDALANAKLMTSQVAMHLDRGWRDRLFAQLDDLLKIEDWHDDDQPILARSFATFLRMILYQNPERRPGLGISHQGNLIAAWTSGADKLTLEFLPNDSIRWVLSCETDGERERAAGETPVTRLPEVLRPYTPERWFSDGRKIAG